MPHVEKPDRRHNLPVIGLAFIALTFFLIAGANVYMQDNRDSASKGASTLKHPSTILQDPEISASPRELQRP